MSRPHRSVPLVVGEHHLVIVDLVPRAGIQFGIEFEATSTSPAQAVHGPNYQRWSWVFSTAIPEHRSLADFADRLRDLIDLDEDEREDLSAIQIMRDHARDMRGARVDVIVARSEASGAMLGWRGVSWYQVDQDRADVARRRLDLDLRDARPTVPEHLAGPLARSGWRVAFDEPAWLQERGMELESAALQESDPVVAAKMMALASECLRGEFRA